MTTRAVELFDILTRGGEEAVAQLVEERAFEAYFVDFKQSGDNGAGRTLHPSDSKNLAKAISGFGNSEGGLIVWGVECRPDQEGVDIARALVPISDATGFATRLQGTVSRSTIPPHTGVHSEVIARRANGSGFVATLIPKSDLVPLRSLADDRYYMRAGSDFARVSHDVLSGMFGRRPAPSLAVRFRAGLPEFSGQSATFYFYLVAVNGGPGIATDLFAQAEILSDLGDGNSVKCHPGRCMTDQVLLRSQLGRHPAYSLTGRQPIRLPPLSDTRLIPFEVKLAKTPTKPLHVRGIVGSQNSPPMPFELFQTAALVETAYDRMALIPKGGVTVDNARPHIALLLGVAPEAVEVHD